MGNIGDALAHEWNAIRHHQEHPDQPQETAPVSRIADARNAITAASARITWRR